MADLLLSALHENYASTERQISALYSAQVMGPLEKKSPQEIADAIDAGLDHLQRTDKRITDSGTESEYYTIMALRLSHLVRPMQQLKDLRPLVAQGSSKDTILSLDLLSDLEITCNTIDFVISNHGCIR